MSTNISSGFGALLGQNPAKPSAQALGDAGLSALARVPHQGAGVAGAFTDAMMMLREAILGGDRRPAVLASFADNLQRLRDLPEEWDIAGALMVALQSGYVLPYSVVRPATLVLKNDPAFAEAFAMAERGDSEGILQLLETGRLRRALSHPLLLELLRLTVSSGPELEFILATARRHFTMHAREAFDPATLAFCTALAEQCFLNEYAFPVNDQERHALARLAADSPQQAAILASYTPLSLLAGAVDHADARLVRQQITEPTRERELEKGIATLRPITDATSQTVRALYEENPYPRWVMAHPSSPQATLDVFRSRYPNADLAHLARIETPEILVAGCGTGQQLMTSVAGYRSYRLTAIDLSRASLAFAARKIEELKLPNIRLLQADILDLEALDQSFDVIEAAGVLHHMKDPREGWRALGRKLKPGGVMLIALYSTIARRGILAVREWAKAKGFASTHEGIVAFRQAALAILRDPRHPDRPMMEAAGLAASVDFFAVSTCRDLIFHPHEQSFTIPEIAGLIAELGFVFRGFTLPSPAFLNAYRARFPNDPAGLNLANWDVFERENPSLFVRMYAFTVQKTG